VTEDINVTARKHIQTYRETITPVTQEEVTALIEKLRALAKRQRVTGTISLVLSQGGVRNVIVENIEEVDKK
jgi:hypothetical protein